MNKRQLIVIWIAGVLLAVVAVNLFLLDGLILCKPLYDFFYPIATELELFLRFFNTALPILVSAGLLVYLLRKKR